MCGAKFYRSSTLKVHKKRHDHANADLKVQPEVGPVPVSEAVAAQVLVILTLIGSCCRGLRS